MDNLISNWPEYKSWRKQFSPFYHFNLLGTFCNFYDQEYFLAPDGFGQKFFGLRLVFEKQNKFIGIS